MFFNDKASFHKYPEFKELTEQIALAKRDSAIRLASTRAIEKYRTENATSDEKSYFEDLIPKVIKDARGQMVPAKRRFDREIIVQGKTFESDGLDRRSQRSFHQHALPKREDAIEKQLGLSIPAPDYTYGLKVPTFPDPEQPVLPAEAKTNIAICSGLRHPFFVIENKGCEGSIEEAENQAIRSGAALVAARHQLKKMTNDDREQETGPDHESFAFSCTWIPQFAKVFVHWREQRANDISIYHMNCLRIYLLDEGASVGQFRSDVHNILDWGVSKQRIDQLQELERQIAQRCNQNP